MNPRWQSEYPAISGLIGKIVTWLRRQKKSLLRTSQIRSLDAAEARAIARDLGLTVTQLEQMARKEPGRSPLLQDMLKALRIEAKALPTEVERDLELVCAACADTRRCKYEIAEGTAVTHFSEYCPNATTLRAMAANSSSKDC